MRRIHDEEAGSNVGSLREARGPDALARRKDELEMVLGAAGIGFCRVNRELRLSGMNSQFKVLFGLAPDAGPIWSDIAQSLAAEDRNTLECAIGTVFEHGEAIELAVRTSWSDEGPRWVSLRGRALADVRGSRPDLLLVARDATEEQRAVCSLAAAVAGERRSRDAAEAANRSKDEFLSVISHELRSPLNAILGWNRILAIKRGDDAEVKAVAPRIEQSAKAQLKMVNDLLDLGRIGTGKLRITPRQIRLSYIAAVAIDAIRPAAAAKGIEIITDVHTMTMPIFGDPHRLSQVIANLLSNALKFTPRGGRIAVRLRDADGRAALSVMDTGQGIAADLLPHIFDRFRQGDSSTTRGAGGLGLGLTLVREIVALHGGTVAASSEGTDRGSTFVVTLPTAGAVSTLMGDGHAQPRNSHAEQLAGLSILVVDDEADARAVVAETLRLEGAQVTIGDSARAALEYLGAPDARFDVLVTDIGMPEEDGYSLVRKLRTLSSGERMVAIALTGYASRGDIDAAIDAGFDLHVPKPVDFDSFVPIIRRLAATR
jgi:two-component system CheB/CheR fusion protein